MSERERDQEQAEADDERAIDEDEAATGIAHDSESATNEVAATGAKASATVSSSVSPATETSTSKTTTVETDEHEAGAGDVGELSAELREALDECRRTVLSYESIFALRVLYVFDTFLDRLLTRILVFWCSPGLPNVCAVNIIPADTNERYLAGWPIVHLNQWAKEQERLLILTSKNIYRVSSVPI